MPRSHIGQLGVGLDERLATGVRRGGNGYPRPLLQRDGWTSLDGTWEFAIDVEGKARAPSDVTFDARIEVPFSPETARSGIGDTGLYRACWYRRSIDVAERPPDERVFLHFGAVDYETTVWIDGAIAL